MTPMQSKEARAFIMQKGIPMSKSKLYKLVASKKIKFHRVENRLLFYKEQLEEYCKSKIVTPEQNGNAALESVINSAQKSC